nr:RibD C-terminal domain protein [uncultured bacterium]
MHVFLIAAMTADGFIGQDSHQSSMKWTSAEDKKWFGARTKQARVVVMGNSTFATVGRALPERLTVIYTKDPTEKPETDTTQIRYTNVEPVELLKQLEQEGYSEIAICGGSSIYYLFANAGLIDTLYLTVEPKAFGKGVPLFSGPLDLNLQLKKMENLSPQTLLLEYSVVKNS